MKRCSLCKELRPQEEYYDHPGTKSGLQSQCKRCIAVSKKVRQRVYDQIALDKPVSSRNQACGILLAEVS